MSDTASDSYAEQQQAAQDGEIHLDVPVRGPEVNPETYKDVEPMLFRGFLHATAVIGGVRFVFKSLNHHEFDHLRLYADPNASDRRSIDYFYNTFLSFGVFMVDGINILSDREAWIPELIDVFKSQGESARRKIIRNMSEINRRANRAVILTEAFCMESLSRLRWAQYKNMDLTSKSVTGIPGTENLGLNWAQLTWRSINYFEDQKEQAERDWENAKFVASAMVGKGMSRVHAQDKTRREKETTARNERKDRILRFAVLGEPLEITGEEAAPIKVARTLPELTKQLESDLRGEKDWHDTVVEDYERRMQEEYQKKIARVQELSEEHDREHGGRRVVGGTDYSGLNKDEVQERVRKRQEETAKRLSSQVTSPETHNPKIASTMNKWLNKEVRPALVSDKDLPDQSD